MGGCSTRWHRLRATRLREEIDRQAEHRHRYDDDEQPEQIPDYASPVAWPRGPDRPIDQALAVTIAIGHARIVTFIGMTTERTEGTDMARGDQRAAQRQTLLEEHRAARARREAADLGSDEFRAAAEEIARIEIALNRLEEPDPGV